MDGSYAFLYAGRNNGVYLRQTEEAEAERMSDREKYVVPNWVADSHNSRVPEEDRLPLGGSAGSADVDEAGRRCSFAAMLYSML